MHIFSFRSCSLTTHGKKTTNEGDERHGGRLDQQWAAAARPAVMGGWRRRDTVYVCGLGLFFVFFGGVGGVWGGWGQRIVIIFWGQSKETGARIANQNITSAAPALRQSHRAVKRRQCQWESLQHKKRASTSLHSIYKLLLHTETKCGTFTDN